MLACRSGRKHSSRGLADLVIVVSSEPSSRVVDRECLCGPAARDLHLCLMPCRAERTHHRLEARSRIVGFPSNRNLCAERTRRNQLPHSDLVVFLPHFHRRKDSARPVKRDGENEHAVPCRAEAISRLRTPGLPICDAVRAPTMARAPTAFPHRHADSRMKLFSARTLNQDRANGAPARVRDRRAGRTLRRFSRPAR